MKKFLIITGVLLCTTSLVFASSPGNAHKNNNGKGHANHKGNGYGHHKTSSSTPPVSVPPVNSTVTNNVTGGSSTSSAIATASATGNVTNINGLSGSGAGGGVSVSSADEFRSYSAPGLSSSEGTDTVQVGSLLFGSIGVSTDERSLKLRRSYESIAQMRRLGLITYEQEQEFAQYVYEELRKELEPSKCFGFIKCGKERKLTNLFKLI